MNFFKTFFVPAFVLFSICVVATLLLALTNNVTAPKIALLAEKSEVESRMLVLSSAKGFSQGKDITLEGTQYTYYEGVDENDNTVGFVFTTVENGYGGEMKVMTGVKSDGTVDAVKILEINETAGLGMNAKNEGFLDQYHNKSEEIFISKDKPGDNSIDALTGATVTSKAVTQAVNTALNLYDEVKGGANNG